MTTDEVILRVETLKEQIDQADLTTNNLLRLVPSFRLDWGWDDDRVTDEFNIGVTKPILLTGLANEKHKMKSSDRLTKDNKIAQLLVDTFIKEKKLSKNLLLQIHKDIIMNGGAFRTREVIVNDITYAVNSIFVDPKEIDHQITELIEWYNKESQLGELHAVELGSIFHHNLVRIHPFIDGNGRLARIITSLILLSKNIAPPMVNSEDRFEYINALRKADLNDIAAFVQFLGKRIVSSMEFVLSIK